VIHKALATLLACLPAGIISADTLVLPPADVDVVGQVQFMEARQDDTLLDIARRNDLGQNEILLANPAVDRWLPETGSIVVLPNRYIIPDAERTGLILNLPEMRLYYFPKAGPGRFPVMITHPVSVGRMDWVTPLGKTKVASKQKDPSWRPPQSIKEEAAQDGTILPDVIPAGPDNPLGRYAMRLGIPGYLIHSTNKPYGVGMRVTHGCVRMYPEDIEALFNDVPVGTPVQIVNQPIKLGWLADTLFIELHPPLDEDLPQYEDYLQRVLDAIAEFIGDRDTTLEGDATRTFTLNGKAIRQAVEEKSGIPVAISR
jgi:L,D-transpeptidase ErfK/SrfK